MDFSNIALPVLEVEKHDIGNQQIRWIRAFSNFYRIKMNNIPSRIKAMLLHCTCMSIQDIYFNLPPEKINPTPFSEDKDRKKYDQLDYEMTIKALDEPRERNIFRGIKKGTDEIMKSLYF